MRVVGALLGGSALIGPRDRGIIFGKRTMRVGTEMERAGTGMGGRRDRRLLWVFFRREFYCES